ncbi:MAG: HAMP domain-containing histidine kinase, partial [Myxococcales bacterium]|nr:HAMP domain-containing histidine kinase [Myxococcales bacterium]
MSDEFDHLAQQLAPLLLDRSPDVYLLVDPTRLAILAARGPTERLLGRPACHMVGLPLQALRPRQPPARLAVLGPAHLVQPGQWAEMAVANAEGTTRVCAAWITRIGATEHDPVLVRLTDVSERFELAQRLREVQQQARKAAAERIQDRLASEEQKRSNLLYIFTAGLSHELNNPLSAALANFSAAQDICREASERPSPQNSAEMHELMRDAQSALRRMETVVKKLRQLEYLPRVQPLEVATWIRQRPDLRDIEVVAPQTLSALSDPILLERILDPLLDNARRAMNDRPGIRLSTGKNGDEFFLQVEDQGPGIPP